MLHTGRTGFIGSWLALWLHRLGAQIVAYALPQPDQRALYHRAGVERMLTTCRGSIRDVDRLQAAFTEFRPRIVIRTVTQALVRPSFRQPVETYATNATRACRSG